VRRSFLRTDKPNVDTPAYALQQGVMPPQSALIRQCLSSGRSAQHVCTPNASPCVGAQNAANLNWPRGVTASTLDSESSDRGSNPRQAFCQYRADLTSPGPCTTHAAALLTHRLRMFTGVAQIWQEHVHEKEACEVSEKSIRIRSNNPLSKPPLIIGGSGHASLPEFLRPAAFLGFRSGVPLTPTYPATPFFTIPERARAHVVQTTKCNPSRSNTHRGARTHDHKVEGLALCRMS
jgi:hypothetical protein